MPTPTTNIKETDQIDSVSDLIAFVKQNCDPAELTLFRGQQEDHQLLPNIARLQTRKIVEDAETAMLNDFKRRSIPYLSMGIETDWDWLALAQHHGMATRLLDWTTNPLSALWFTVERPPVEDHPGVLWLYKPDTKDVVLSKTGTSPFIGTKTEVFQPDHITSRIVSQAGWFTVHKYQTKSTSRTAGFIALNRLARAQPLLTKLTVPPAQFATLRQELDRCGVNSSLIYPGLEGICRHIQWSHSWLKDECPATPPP